MILPASVIGVEYTDGVDVCITSGLPTNKQQMLLYNN